MNRRAFLRCGGLAGGYLLAGTPFRLLGRSFGRVSVPCVERMYVSMGTVVRFQVYHEDPTVATAAIHEAIAVIQQIHGLMSVQEPTSELARWNRSRRGLDAPLHPLTAEALDEALRLARLTEGRFDPTVGAAVAAYERGASALPLHERMGGWDAANRRFQKVDPRVHLDLGGSAKGWAVDRAVDVLRRHGVTSALVNAGGDLRVTGRPPGAASWSVGIRDPRRPDDVLGVLALEHAAVATSADYETEGSTLVDPRDLSRVRLGGSVSVVASTCGEADGLATALTVEPDLGLLPSGCAGLVAKRDRERFCLTTTPGLALTTS